MDLREFLYSKQFTQDPLVITIGNFDGVHQGHQAIIHALKQKAAKIKGRALVLTFDNHPSSILRPERAVQRIYTAEHRNKLLLETGIDGLIHFPFTPEIAQQSAEEFLDFINAYIPFKGLVLGHDATIGKDRHGDQKHLAAYAKQKGICLEYLDAVKVEETIVSSTRIREYIKQGNFEKAALMLGRPYTIYSKIEPGLGVGKKALLPTANIKLTGLCTPPYGVYAVQAKLEDNIFNGVANLGIAPTVRESQDPVLEAYLFNFDRNAYGHFVEVFFQGFIRPEKKFDSIEDLRKQIEDDVQTAQHVLTFPRSSKE